MIRSKILLVLMGIMLFLSACAGGARDADFIKVSNPITTPDFLKQSMSVDHVKYIQPVLIDGPLVENYKVALEKTLVSQSLAAPDGQPAKYKVSVDYDVDNEAHIFDSHMSFTIKSDYFVSRVSDNNIIFNKRVVTNCDRERTPFLVAMVDGPFSPESMSKVQAMINCTVHNNIEQFLQSLSAIEKP